MNGNRDRPPKDSIFALALVLVLVGTTLLFLTTGALPGFSRLWPMGLAAIGCLILYLGTTRRLAAAWLFIGTAFLLSGVLFIVRGFFGWPIVYYWPFFMIVTGFSIVVPGYRRYRRPRPSYLVPAISFILMGAFFLLFSFDFIQFSFRRFFSEWWPVLLIASGIVLLVLYFYNRTRFARSRGRANP